MKLSTISQTTIKFKKNRFDRTKTSPFRKKITISFKAIGQIRSNFTIWNVMVFYRQLVNLRRIAMIYMKNLAQKKV